MQSALPCTTVITGNEALHLHPAAFRKCGTRRTMDDCILQIPSRTLSGSLEKRNKAGVQLMNDVKPKTILLVEDEAIIALSEKMLLEEYGYRVITATTGMEAVVTAQKIPGIDLILMDINLGDGIDGTEAAEMILKERDVPIMFLSSHTEREVVEKTEGITSYGYIVKNAGPTVLLASVKMAFRLSEAHGYIKTQQQALAAGNEELRATIEELEATNEEFEASNEALVQSQEELTAREEAVNFEREQLLSIFDSIPQSIYVSDPLTYRVLFVNQTLRDMLGHDPVGGICYREFQGFDSPCEFCTNEIILNNGGIPHTWEYHNHSLGRVFEIVDRVIRWPDGSDVRFEMAVDITERKQATEALQLQSRSHQLLIDIASTYINLPPESVDSVINASLGELCTFVSADRAYVFIYDFDRQTCSNTHEWCAGGIAPQIDRLQDVPLDAMPDWVTAHTAGKPMYVPDVSALPPERLREILSSQEIKSLLTVPLMDGSACLGFIGFDSVRQCHNYSHAEQELLNIFAKLLVNAWKHRHREAVLKESEERYRSLVENANDIIYSLSPDGMFTYVSPNWTTILGHAVSEVEGHHFMPFVHPEDVNTCIEFLRKVIETGEQQSGVEYRVRHQDGRWRWHTSSASSVRGTSGEGARYIGIARDITESKLSEERIKTLLTEKDILLSEVHHRIKNNMSVMTSILSLQIKTMKDPSDAAALQDAISRMQSMGLLYDRLFRSENMNSMPVKDYLVPLTEEIVNLFHTISSVTIEYSIDDFILGVKVLSPLGIIINELITNAMKYAFTGMERGILSISALKKGKVVTITVGDNGCGIPVSVDFNNSSGFGITLVGLLAQQIGGTATIERNGGTRFIIEFTV
ncbi:MAG TPA: PAS domain S-box protein [Spirochaetota bacterium]|nr:PAS domain S-box protein [Spirochaetota bacterium]